MFGLLDRLKEILCKKEVSEEGTTLEVYYLVKKREKYYGLCGVSYSKKTIKILKGGSSKTILHNLSSAGERLDLYLDSYYEVDENTFNKLKGEY